MQKIFFILCLLFLVSCQESSDSITLEGTLVGAKEIPEIYVHKFSNDNNQPYVLDTVAVQDGKFSVELPKSEVPEITYLGFKNQNGNVIFFQESNDLKATVYLDSMYASQITGSKENELFNKFTAEVKGFNLRKQEKRREFQDARAAMDNETIVRIQTENAVLADEERVFKKEFIKNNPESLLSLMVAAEMLARQEMTSKEVSKVLENTDPALKDSFLVKELTKTVKEMGAVEVGSVAPDFSAPTPEGKELALSEIKGKVTLIDFWASWCRPCRIENPNVVKVYNAYKDQGFEIISVSLDRPNQREQWLKAIEDDNMTWHHISNLQFWNDPIAKKYGVKAIPATFILDENGVIVAKDLRGDALGQKVGELLSK